MNEGTYENTVLALKMYDARKGARYFSVPIEERMDCCARSNREKVGRYFRPVTLQIHARMLRHIALFHKVEIKDIKRLQSIRAWPRQKHEGMSEREVFLARTVRDMFLAQRKQYIATQQEFLQQAS